MAWKAVVKKEDEPKICPKCKHELITIDGTFIRWLTCTKCKFKKLLEKEREVVKVFPIKEEREEKEPEKLKVIFE